MRAGRWIIPSLLTALAFAMASEELGVHSGDDELHITAPRLHFLTGSSLDRLKNGAAVPFDFQLSLSAGSRTNLFDRAVERIAISYDLWEEKYSVTRLSGSGTLRGAIARRSHERRTASHLTAAAAERWCIDNMAVSKGGLDPSQALWVRLEVRSAEPKDANPLFGDTGVSLNRLIDLFSHPPRSGQQHWTLEAGPLRLSEVRRAGAHGS